MNGLFSSVILWLSLVGLQTGDCGLCELGAWLTLPPRVEAADAIVVFGGDHRRLQPAIDLYRAGVAPALWYTGASAESELPTRDHAQVAHDMAVAQGVPGEAITLLATANTWEDGQQIAELAQARGVDSLLVVTSWYHSRRALCVLQYHMADSGIQVYYQPAATGDFDASNWWQSASSYRLINRELSKLIFYRLNYGINFNNC